MGFGPQDIPGLRLRTAALIAVALLLAGASAASAATIRSGPLRAHVSADPFAISFAQRGGPAPGAGRLELRGALGTALSTRALALERHGRGLTATVATTDPLGATVELEISPQQRGAITIDARAVGGVATRTALSFTAAPGELFTGFGERSNAVDFRGMDVLNYVADGPLREEDRLYPKIAVPPWGARDRDDDTYYPVPWMLSGRGYGALIGNDETSRFDMGRAGPGRWSAEAEARRLRLTVYAGPQPADALRRFTAATGRQPRARAGWTYGPWFQTGQPNVIPLAEEQEIIRVQRAADVPVSAMETQMHFLPCGAHRGLAAYERARTEQAHRAGLAQLAYFNPHVCASYGPVFGQASAAGVLQRVPATELPFIYPAFVGGSGPLGFTEEPLAQFDFTATGAEEFYERLVREAYEQGKDGWMEDFGENTPPFVASADGTAADEIHNRYPRDYHCAVRRIERRLDRPVTRHQRSGWTGAARCASIVWGGDPTTVWGFDGLASAVTQALTIGMSGVARWGSDIGGYNTYGPWENLSRELLHRWIQFGAVSAVMRTKRSGLAFPPYERPQVFDPESISIWRRYTKLHTQLYPYLRAADAAYRRSGMPIMRHGLLTHPGDERAVRAHDQFMLGPDLLAAPVLEPGATNRRLYAPRGRWVDLWRSVAYRERDGALVPKGAAVLRGRREHVLPAPEDELPLLIRAGAALPLLSPRVDTLSPYDGKRIVTLAERRRRLVLLAFPRGRWRGSFGERGRIASRTGRGHWRLRVRGGGVQRVRLRAAFGAARGGLRPRRVLANGAPLPASRWSYRARSRVLTAGLKAGDGGIRLDVLNRMSGSFRQSPPG